MAVSKFIRGIAKKIEEVSGVDPQRSVMPKEVLFFQVEPDGRQVILRTAEETQNMDVVHLKQFDPYFQNSDIEIPCQFPGCSKTRKFVQECESQEKFKKVKRDLFLCEDHREKLLSAVSKFCNKEKMTLHVETFKNCDFTGYTSLIGVLENAFMYLQSKWLRGVNDFLLAEIFLNTRNFLLITNALLNPDEENTVTVLGPYLRALQYVLRDSVTMRNGLLLLKLIMCAIFAVYGIMYEWIHIPITNSGAKLGTGVGILAAMLVNKMFRFSPSARIGYSLGIVVATGLIGASAFSWSLDPQIDQRIGLDLFWEMTASLRDDDRPRPAIRVRGNPDGDLQVLNVGEQPPGL